MSRKYLGKTCPYCKTPFVEGDTVVFCSICDMPHHLACWQDNHGCTTFGCTGSIKEIIGDGFEKNIAANSIQHESESSVTHTSIVSTKEEQKEKPIEILYESKEMVFMSGVPLVLENAALIIDRTKDKLFARCTFRSITDKEIKAMLIELACQDVWGNSLGEPVSFQYIDLKTKREAKLGQTYPIELVDKSTRKFSVQVKKVLFEDDTVIAGDGVSFTMAAPVLLNQYLKSEELAKQYASETTSKAQFVPEYTESYWRCTCGAINVADENKCYHCGCSKDQQMTALNADVLKANMLRIREEKRIAEEKARAEQAERIRIAEEQVRIEQERKEQEILAAERARKEKRKRIRRRILFIITLAVICALVYVFIVWGVPYIRYQTACKALDNGEYDKAIEIFVELEDYEDSEALLADAKEKKQNEINEARYQEGIKALNDKQYDVAIEIFTELGLFFDSSEKLSEAKRYKENAIKEARYQEGITALNNAQYDEAIEIFTELDSYAESKTKLAEAQNKKEELVKEARYQEGVSAINNAQYDVAIEIFTELGGYSDSKEMLLDAQNKKKEARYQEGITALNNAQYDVAIEIFTELGSYSDSKTKLAEGQNKKEELRKEARYQEGVTALNNKKYDTAIEIFTELGSYSDSKEKLSDAKNKRKEARYQEGVTALNNKKYDTAIEIFTELGSYSDSKTKLAEAQNKRKEIRYQEGITALNNGKYDSAITIFTELGSYSDSKDRLIEAKYERANDLMTSQKYEAAYKLFKDVGNYSDAKDKLTTCIYSWADAALSNSKKTDAEKFKSTVTLNSGHHNTIYTKIWNKIDSHTEFDYWDDYWLDTENASVVYAMLQTLPSSYEETATLCKLFKALTNGDFHPVKDYIRSNKSFIKSVWHIGFMRDFAEGDDMIYAFLEDYWTSSDNIYYMHFYEHSEGGTSLDFNLPWVDKPYGTKYYGFEDLILYWDDDSNNHLAKVFRFTIEDHDTIKVYCYEDGKTYTLYR